VVFVTVLTVLLYMPFFWIVKHLMLIVGQALQDGSSMGKLGIGYYLFEVGQLHPELVRSRNIVVGGLVYFMVLVIARALYAALLGI